jgi:hypothetical protein
MFNPLNSPPTKTCLSCGEKLLLCAFSPEKGYVRSRCKKCRRYQKGQSSPNYQQKYDVSLQGRWGKLKQSAKRLHGITSTLTTTFEQFADMVSPNKCAYCGGPLTATGHGIDRKNSSKGYTPENSCASCWVCNCIRGEDNISHEEMFEVAALLKRLRS